MQFTVPQFIERETKIVGPLTFKQFIFVGIAGGLCLFLYFTVSFTTFIILTVLILGTAFSLAFVKIKKIPLPVIIKNFFSFLTEPKVYLWKKKTSPPKIQRKKVKTIEKEEKEEPKVVGRSKLKDLSTRLKIK